MSLASLIAASIGSRGADAASTILTAPATSHQVNRVFVAVILSAVGIAVLVIVAAVLVNRRHRAHIRKLTQPETWAQLAEQLESISGKAAEVDRRITHLHGDMKDIDERATWLAILLSVVGAVIALGTGIAIEWAHTTLWKDAAAFAGSIAMSLILAIVARKWVAPKVRRMLPDRPSATVRAEQAAQDPVAWPATIANDAGDQQGHALNGPE